MHSLLFQPLYNGHFLLSQGGHNNLQPGCTLDVILTSLVQFDKILAKFGQQQLVMVNDTCGFNQSENREKFWMNNNNIYIHWFNNDTTSQIWLGQSGF